MKKLLAFTITVVAVMIFMFASMGAVAYFPNIVGTASDSIYLTKDRVPFRLYFHDTLTLHAEDGMQWIDFGTYIYDMRIRSINPATDSGYFKICFGDAGTQGIWHHDSVARNLSWIERGQASGSNPPDTTTLYSTMELKRVAIQVIVDGTADSTCTIEVFGYR